MALYAFDGRAPDGANPSFRVHFELTGLEPGARRRSAVVMTRDLWKEPLLAVTGTCRACGIDGEPHDIVLLGMDFLARCTLRLSGPTNEQVLTLHGERG